MSSRISFRKDPLWWLGVSGICLILGGLIGGAAVGLTWWLLP